MLDPRNPNQALGVALCFNIWVWFSGPILSIDVTFWKLGVRFERAFGVTDFIAHTSGWRRRCTILIDSCWGLLSHFLAHWPLHPRTNSTFQEAVPEMSSWDWYWTLCIPFRDSQSSATGILEVIGSPEFLAISPNKTGYWSNSSWNGRKN